MDFPFPIVRIWWKDAVSQHRWTAAADILGPRDVLSVGFLVAEARGYVSVAATVTAQPDDSETDPEDIGDYTTISRKMVERIDILTDTGWQPYKKSRKPKDG